MKNHPLGGWMIILFRAKKIAPGNGSSVSGGIGI